MALDVAHKSYPTCALTRAAVVFTAALWPIRLKCSTNRLQLVSCPLEPESGSERSSGTVCLVRKRRSVLLRIFLLKSDKNVVGKRASAACYLHSSVLCLFSVNFLRICSRIFILTIRLVLLVHLEFLGEGVHSKEKYTERKKNSERL